MNTEERLSKIEDKLDCVLEKIGETIPRVKEHHRTLYGNGNPGLKTIMETHIEAEKHCPARLAYTEERKKTNIAAVAMIIAALSFIITGVSVAITVIEYSKGP